MLMALVANYESCIRLYQYSHTQALRKQDMTAASYVSTAVSSVCAKPSVVS